MNIDLDTDERRQSLKAAVLKAINKLIDEHPLEYHPLLYNMMLRELDILKADNSATNIPIIQTLMSEAGLSKLQAWQFIDNLDLENRTRVATALGKQIRDLKALGF